MSFTPQKFILIPLERYNNLKEAATKANTKQGEHNSNGILQSTPETLKPAILPELSKEHELEKEQIKSIDTHQQLVNILEAFPPRSKPRARLIYAYFHSPDPTKVISSSSNGELTIGQRCYQGSSITDLLYDTTCRKRGYVPLYAQQFYQALNNNNAPAGLILNTDRRKWMTSPNAQQPVNNTRHNLARNWKPY